MLNVLVIDDEQSLLKLFSKILVKAGFRVETAITGYEGLEKFHDKHFDLVITDILMPGMHGNDIVNHIRNSQKPSTAIIGISGTPWKLSEHDFDSVLPRNTPRQNSKRPPPSSLNSRSRIGRLGPRSLFFTLS